MKLIAHRGNISGPNSDKENHPDYIETALSQGFDVEIDLRIIDGKYYLGHDLPQYEVKKNFIFRDELWIHCKDIKTFDIISGSRSLNSFFHDQDDCALTTHGWIWTFPRNIYLSDKSVAVMPERVPEWDLSRAYGICTDYPVEYQKDLSFKI